MRSALLAVAPVALLSTACSHIPGMGSKASSPTVAATKGTPLAKDSGQLDAEVSPPAGFPTDVPVYPGARLTAGAAFTSNGQVAWGMEWETLDPPAKVRAFYEGQFAKGDWVLSKPDASNPGQYTATIGRKSNSHATGTLAIIDDAGITMIALSLLSAA